MDYIGLYRGYMGFKVFGIRVSGFPNLGYLFWGL